MSDEMARQTMLMVAEVCDRFAIGAAMCSIYELAISHVIVISFALKRRPGRAF